MTETIFMVDEEENTRFETNDRGQVTVLIWLPRNHDWVSRLPEKDE